MALIAVVALAACSADTGTPSSDTTGVIGTPSDTASGDAVGSDGGADVGIDDVDPGADGDGSDDAEEEIGPGAICGNDWVEAGEVCDDGNNFPGDGCNANCTSDERCGNAIMDLGESCDDGNVLGGDGCDSLCQTEQGCGNGVLDVGEQCDDSNIVDGDGCSSDCIREIFIAVDSDGDTIADFDEGNGFVDTDGDGVTDDLDTDSDDDGIPDSVEAGDDDMTTEPADTDRDGVYDFRDLDADDDDIPDSVEGSNDPDGDGYGCFADPDCDGDYVPDIVEGVGDSDGDLVPDYRDTDSDDDGILDEHELFADSDHDGVPNRLDEDSDGDTIPDYNEAGDLDPATYPTDFDGDGQPDYIDVDSDGDGLPDAAELGCARGSADRHDPDTDDDGYSDLAETLVGSDPCTRTTPARFRDFTDFFFILPDEEPAQEAPLEFSSDIVQADVSIAMDTTGSMGGEIDNLKSTFSSVIFPQINSAIPNVAFGVSTFDDFLCGGHGSGDDRPFILRQRVTTAVSTAQSAMNSIPRHYGADYYESGYESMYQVATGEGVSACSTSVPPFNPAAGRIPGVADGTIGGVGFREGAFPVLVHVTDAPSHDASAYGGGAHSGAQAIAALNANKIRFVGVVSGSDPRAQLENVARATGGVVPACAWDGARPGGCGASQCCTGYNGAGRGTSGGTCPLVFDIDAGGGGLGGAIVTAITALVNTTSFDVTARVRRDEDEYRLSGIDTRCFIRSIVPDSYVSSGSCTTTPTVADINPVDGRMDSFRNVTPGTQLFFDVTAENDGCVRETDMPQAFSAYIDVIGDSLTVLDTQLVTIIVPADTTNPTTVP